jgi:hypothetical protein
LLIVIFVIGLSQKPENNKTNHTYDYVALKAIPHLHKILPMINLRQRLCRWGRGVHIVIIDILTNEVGGKYSKYDEFGRAYAYFGFFVLLIRQISKLSLL